MAQAGGRTVHRDLTPWALFAVALLARLVGISWGLPEVFEEAFPLKLAWRMHGFESAPPSLDPRFFHYPSLVIYVEYLVIVAVKVVLALTHTATDTAALKWTWFDLPGAFYVPGRAAIALFGAATTLPAYWMGRGARGPATGLIAGLLVAFHPALIRKSQMIDVDVPLTFFVMAALAAAWSLTRADGGRRVRQAAFAGALVGLATSTKYPGILAALPLVVVLVQRAIRFRGPSRVPEFAFAGLAMMLAFAATSPYFFLDSATAMRDLAAERTHMELGHFGSDAGSSVGFYAASWFGSTMGWALGAAALLGALQFGIVKREPWALVLLTFVVPLLAILCSAPLRADRYLLPAVPAVMLIAAAWLVALFESRTRSRADSRDALVLVALCLLTDGSRFAAHARVLGPDTRTVSKRWIERNLPSGSMVILEPYGPELPGPLARLAAGVGGHDPGGVQFWTLEIPMFQVEAERSAVFYDPRLYPQADAWVVTGAVRDRYLAEPARFPVQSAFYRWLAAEWREVARFRLATGSGPEIVVYSNPAFDVPFSQRVVPAPRPTPFMLQTGGRDGEAAFYRNLGMNYLGFGRHAEAADCLRLALSFPESAGANRAQLLQALATAERLAGRAGR